jgi:hypothetical protein
MMLTGMAPCYTPSLIVEGISTTGEKLVVVVWVMGKGEI